MDKVNQYRQRARECRVSANRAITPEVRGHYEGIAKVWEKLADERIEYSLSTPASNRKARAQKTSSR